MTGGLPGPPEPDRQAPEPDRQAPEPDRQAPDPRPQAPDPGRQPERTRLAWRRTALAMTVVAGLTVRLALTTGPAGVLLAATAVLGWAALMFLLRPWRAGPPPGRAAPGRLLPLSALVAIGYAGLGVLLVLGALG